MSTSPAHDLTGLLLQWQSGDGVALKRLIAIVYRELHRLAARYLRGERPHHTLQATALVNEAYLRLVSQNTPDIRSRSQFFGFAAHIMRQVLVDSARSRKAQKRDGGSQVTLEDFLVSAPERAYDILALDEALSELAKIQERKCKVIEMRYFGGLSNEEIAETLGVSVPTVVRDRRFSEAWLQRRLNEVR